MTQVFTVDATGVIRNEDGEIVTMLEVIDADGVLETLDSN